MNVSRNSAIAAQEFRAEDLSGVAPRLEAWIVEGTTRDEALAMIDRLRERVAADFDHLVGSAQEAEELARSL